jgi:hypothetical protein
MQELLCERKAGIDEIALDHHLFDKIWKFDRCENEETADG